MDWRDDFLKLDVLYVPVIRVLLEIDRHTLLPVVVDEWRSGHDRRFADGPFVTILFHFPLGCGHGGRVGHNLGEIPTGSGSRDLKRPVIDRLDTEIRFSWHLSVQRI